jgi:Ca-activated chloride channel homolog
VDLNFLATSGVKIDLKSSDKNRGNKDFILKYRLTGNKIQEGILCYEGEKENYFLMMMQPPKTVSESELPPREYIFIMDISGSQSGFPIEVSKELMKNLLTNLRPQDRFNVLLFCGSSAFMSDSSLVANPANIQAGIDLVTQQRGGGSTNLLGALQKAMSFKRTSGYSRTFAISTDGYITVEKETFQYVKDNLGDANFFTFGIGSSVNRYLIEGLAHAGMGEPFIVSKQNEASAIANKFKTYIESPVLANININYNGFNVYDIVPLKVPDVFSLRPIIVFGKYKGNPSGTINISGITAAGKYSNTLNVSMVKAEKSNSALKYLWARHKIREYDFAGKIGNDVKAEITKLGLDYGLLTEYTSFVAVDNEIRNKTGKSDSVAQPLSLPDGVSKNALGTYGVAGNNANSQSNNSNSGSTNYSKTLSGTSKNSSGKGAKSKAPAYNGYTVTTIDDSKHSKAVGKKNEQAQPELSLKDVDKKKESEKLGEADTAVEFTSVDILPEFPGGTSALNKYISSNIKYPDAAKSKSIQGTVYVKFIVATDGSIKNIVILKSPDQSLSDEVIRMLKAMPKWAPGKKNGKVAECNYTLPVKFKL